MQKPNSESTSGFFFNAYSKILPGFIDSLAEAGGGFDALFASTANVFSSVLELPGVLSSFAVLLFDNTEFSGRCDTSYFESSVVSLDEFGAVLRITAELLTDNAEASPKIFTHAELEARADHEVKIPCSALAVPIVSTTTVAGFALVFYHEDTEHFAVDSHQMQFLSRVMHLVALACQSEFSNARFERYLMNDYLTELPNRDHIYESIIYSLQTAEELMTRFALLIIRVNGLKHINNSLGIVTGDMMLKEMGALIKTAASKPVGEGEALDVLVGRLSGGDFVALVTLPTENRNENNDETAARTCCEAIIEKTKNYIEINGYKLYPSANIGASIYPYHGDTAEELLRKADLAKSAAKLYGPGSYKIYEHFMDGDAEKILFLNSNLPIAIAENQFELFYQALMDIKTGKIATAEALIRWRHPERGLIQPGEFISFAENNAYGIQIDMLVLSMACDQINAWREKGIDLTVSVNISPKHFVNGLICDSVRKALASKKVAPSRLRIELLESILLEDFDAAVKVLDDLHTLGVTVALDDFGSGYSSLEYVAKLPLDYLKIERAFSMNLHKNPCNKVILETVMTLAKGMQVMTVAEGVEDQAQLDFLRSIGCDIAQGYFINKPMDAESFEKLLAAHDFCPKRP
ncbi:MAG: bifunctional diguanylate cyclase/phosphodiesterase [Defluviitaleaceae bacterium]|nr:bifunctional diguanylate cyclase/phosphodiesterase [Defluviitaleaceae bacterium]